MSDFKVGDTVWFFHHYKNSDFWEEQNAVFPKDLDMMKRFPWFESLDKLAQLEKRKQEIINELIPQYYTESKCEVNEIKDE